MRVDRTAEDRLRALIDDSKIFRYVYSICARYFRTKPALRGLVEDAVNEILIKAWMHRSTFHPPSLEVADDLWYEVFKKWIAQIARNHCIDITRKRQEITFDTPPDKSIPFPDVLEYLPLQSCLKKLEEADFSAYETLMLQEGQQYSQSEVATILNVPIQTVQIDVARAKRKMKKCLEESGAP